MFAQKMKAQGEGPLGLLLGRWRRGCSAGGELGHAASPGSVTSSRNETIVCHRLKNAGYVRAMPVHFKSRGKGLSNIENGLNVIYHFE